MEVSELNDLERLRRSFRPKQITTLFVGESPPHGGTFFYKRDSLLYHRMKESFGETSNFLPAFQAKGFILDDLVLYPINQIQNKNERDQHRRTGVQSLAQRMARFHCKKASSKNFPANRRRPCCQSLTSACASR
jgi:hypothetical protein